MTQDLIDQAAVRREKPCWYLQNPRQAPDGAARLLEHAVYKLLKKYFRNKEYYVDTLELFHTVYHYTYFPYCRHMCALLVNTVVSMSFTDDLLSIPLVK